MVSPANQLSAEFWKKFYLFLIPLAALFALRDGFVDFYYYGYAPNLRITIQYNIVVWGLWVLIAPCVVRLFPVIMRLNKHLRIIVLVLFPFAVATVQVLAHHFLFWSVIRFGQIAWGAFVVSILLMFCFAMKLQEEQWLAETQTAELEARLQEANLANIRKELEPQQIYNSLRSASELIETDPEEADMRLSALGDRLRAVLQKSAGYLRKMTEPGSQIEPRNRNLLPFVSVIWMFFGTAITVGRYLDAVYVWKQPTIDYGWLFRIWLSWLGVSVLSPAILWMNRKFPILPWRLQNTAIHAGFCVLFFFCGVAFPLNMMANGTSHFVETIPAILKSGLAVGFKLDVYAAVLIVAIMAEHYRKRAHDQIQNMHLMTSLSHSELDALRMQLQPHFLFNALNSVTELVHEDPAKARELLVKLEQFLSMTLSKDQEQEITLREEMKFVECYLDMQKVRFPKRLHVNYEIDPCTLDSLVPAMVLQPLIENAVRHGISQTSEPGEVRVRSNCNQQFIELSVEDTGSGSRSEFPETEGAAGTPLREGIGLQNSRKRLQYLYGDNHRFSMSRLPTGGMLVKVEIPRHGA